MDLTPQGNQESQQRRNNAENKTHDSEIDISTAQQVEQPNANASTSERKNEKSFPRLRRLKPLIEAVGIVFLIIYTGVTIGLWCSSRDANKLSHEYFLKDQRPYMWPMNVPLTVKPAPILRPTRTPKSWLRPSAAVSPANTNNASWPRWTRPKAPAGSGFCFDAKGCTLRCWRPGGGSVRPAFSRP